MKYRHHSDLGIGTILFVIIVSVVASLVFLLFFFSQDTITQVIPPAVETQQSSTPQKPELIKIENNTFALYTQFISENELTLIPNFDNKTSTKDLFSKHSCRYGINGGFYTKENRPLGFFYSRDMHTYNQTSIHQNQLFNGYVYKNTSGLYLTTTPPAISHNVLFAFQTGPLITPDQTLNIATDSSSRRMLIAQLSDNSFVFLAITSQDTIHSGPLLSQLPEVLEKSTLDIKQAVNLDGGTASTFYGADSTLLPEVATVGSFLCGR